MFSEAELVNLREEGGCAAGVEEDDAVRRDDLATADVVDHAGHRFAAVDGVEEDAFVVGEQADRFQAAGGGMP